MRRPAKPSRVDRDPVLWARVAGLPRSGQPPVSIAGTCEVVRMNPWLFALRRKVAAPGPAGQ
ncbi:hypothetical protein K7G98_32720 [Saccharothrix sp. MB29]|nr:hypothetical protein [Saccharothrix sp. MB29]